MRFLIALMAASAVVAGCSSAEPSAATEAQLHKTLSGPPNLRAMRDKMAGKTAAPAVGKFAGKSVESANAASAANAGASN
ncbi:MAG TPA: hypothetical protein VG944_17925 [Fimbriimonas sp.]|nr:hypothetical protein [Fimbriimonas sp.]